MRHLFTPEGESELAALVARRPLLGFDFDGTLAPIVAQPELARVPMATLRRLRQLASLLPLAVISGRSVADLRSRLGFEPTYVVGSHGAEDPHQERPASWSTLLEGVRQRLHDAADELQRAGVRIEDKGASLALHYRLSADRATARGAIERVLHPLDPQLHVFGGKMVVNVVPAGADDKAAALRRLAVRTGASAVLYLGDDVNDESVFAAAEPSWLSVRVGVNHGSAARYFIAGPHEVPRLLDRILALIGEPAAR